MSNSKLPIFGEIDLEEDFFEAEFMNSKNQEVMVSIDFEGEPPGNDFSFESISNFLNNIENNLQHIKDNLLSGNFVVDVKDYIEHHMSELKSEPKIQKISSHEQFINELYTSYINIYPTEEENFFSIDFTIDEELTNYILVVSLQEDLSISHITTES